MAKVEIRHIEEELGDEVYESVQVYVNGVEVGLGADVIEMHEVVSEP